MPGGPLKPPRSPVPRCCGPRRSHVSRSSDGFPSLGSCRHGSTPQSPLFLLLPTWSSSRRPLWYGRCDLARNATCGGRKQRHPLACNGQPGAARDSSPFGHLSGTRRGGRHADPLVGRSASRAHASAAVSIGLLFASLVGAGQAFLLVFLAGDGATTDAFLVCYSLYVAVALLGVSLRRSVPPLLGSIDDESAVRAQANELLSRIALAAAVIALGLMASAPLLAGFLTRGLPAGARSTGLLTLVLLAPAAYLQIRAGSISGVLNAIRRFPMSVFLYVFSSTLALGLSAALLPTVGPLGAAIGLLGGSIALLWGHSLYIRRFGLRFRPRLGWLADRGQARLLSFVLPASALGLAQQLNLSLALAALAGTGSGEAITAYAYGYFVVGLMSNLSSYSIALVTLPDTVEAISARGRIAAREQVERTAPFVFAVLVPMVAGFVSFGLPLLEAVFEQTLSPGSVRLLHELGSILGVMAVPLSLHVLVGTVLLALGDRVAAAIVAGFSLTIHATLLFILAPLGPEAVAWAHSAATLLAAVAVILAAFRRSAVGVVATVTKRIAPAFAFALVFPAVRLVSGDLSLWSLAASLSVAAALYASLVVLLWPSVARPFLRLAPRRSPG